MVFFIIFSMSGPSVKKEHSINVEAELQTIQHSGKIQSDLIKTLYIPVMDQVPTPNFGKLVGKLSISGIDYEKSHFWPEFSKSCIKTDWESTIYDVKFGNFRTQLKIVYFNLDSNSLFCSDLLGTGGFGQVIRFRTFTGEFALKNIKCNKNKLKSIDAALQEVFMAKVLSALEVGPKLIDLFSYDAIVFNNCVQYAMEVCRTKFKKSQIESQLKSKGFLTLLKTLHSLNICHMDIKSDNIAWSPSLSRFVFLDFTFTKFIKESVGSKTVTSFEGTFQYASPQMKKRWILQDRSLVDLYYNDLHCLEAAQKEMKASLNESDKMFEFFQAFKNDKQTERLAHNSSLVSYFQLKMSFFAGNISQAISLVQKQTCLVQTFRKMLSRHEEKNRILTGACTLLTQKVKPCQEKAAQIDRILLRYEAEMEQNPLLVTLLEIIEDGSQSLFEKAWQEDSYKQKMFFFIDVYSNQDLQNQPIRKKLVDKIYCQIAPDYTEDSYIMRFRKVIEHCAIHFCKKKNIEVVEKIMSYFVLMQDGQTRKKLEDMMLLTLEQQQDYLEYSERNFKYFVGEIATINPMVTWDLERHIQNSRNLIQKLSKNIEPTDTLMTEISQTLQIIKMIKNYKISNSLFKIDLKEQLRQISALLSKKGEEIRIFTHQILQFKNNGIQLSAITARKQRVFRDHFLHICILQMLITACILKEQMYSLRVIMSSQNFLKKFSTLTHLHILNPSIRSEKQKRVEICKNYLKIKKESGWGLSNQHFWVLDQFYDKFQAANHRLQWFSNLKLSDICNLERVQNIKICLPAVLYYFLNMKFYSGGQKISLESERKLGEISLSFLEYTTDLPIIMKQKAQQNNSPQVEQYIYFKQAVIRQAKIKDMYQKGMALLLLGRIEQATATALQIADSTMELQYYGSLFGIIFYIWESGQQNCLEQANKIILKLIPHLMEPHFRQNLLQSYVCFRNLIKALKMNGMINETFICIHELCQYVESNNINVTNTNLFSRIKELFQIWSLSDIKQLVHTRAKWQLPLFVSCPFLTYILHKASQLIQDIEYTVKKRVIVTAAMFIRDLSHGFFADYRQILYYESYQLKKRKIRTLSELRRIVPQKTLAAFTETFTCSGKGRNKNLLSRQAREQMTDLTRSKALYYYTNCINKTMTAY